MKKSLLVISFLALLLVACDQTGLGIGAAFKNLISLPVQGAQKLANSISGKTYEAYKERTTQGVNRDGSSCYADLPGMGGSDQINQLSRVACQCKAWAQCVKELCSCNVMCPDNFNIFKRPDYSVEPKESNSLSFTNSAEAFTNNKMTQGYCWGHAAMTQRFNRLGFFNASARPEVNGQVLDESSDPQAWKEYYSKIIDQIGDNETADIPGFSDLGEFSSHPVIQEMLADKVAKTWADNAMSFNGLSVSMKTKDMGKEAAKQLITDLEERLANHQSPQLIMTRKDSAFLTHVVLVSSIEKMKSGTTKICLNDNNLSAESNKICTNSLLISADGKIIQQTTTRWVIKGKVQEQQIGFAEMGGVQITNNEDSDTVKQVDALVKHCRNKRSCES